MKRINLVAKRIFLSFLVAIQVLFYPGAAVVQAEESAPSPIQETSTSAVEAASEPTAPSETTPAPSTSAEQSSPTDTGTTDPASSTSTQNTSQETTKTDTTAKVDNVVDSHAQSGDATVKGTKRGGDATSGDAFAMANLINILQSHSNIGNGSLTTFETNIEGDVYGDIFIDPGELSAIQNNMVNASNIQVNVDAAINNDVNLSATSGNATIEGNRKAGNASSGDAHAVANIMNLINSSLTANNSFFGVINIHGNLNGDILLPPEVLETLLTSNTVPTATITADFNTELNNNTNIANNITTAAQSGNALVSGNHRAGDATSGDASTSITVLNLTGQHVVGANTLLVFINVQGKWVGMLVNAPSDSSAAAFGGGITTHNTTDPSNSIQYNNNAQINNNVNVSAESGDASVINNRRAGNATTGNASASANVANIAASQFSLSNWFGVLFINVFGSWLGSFGIDTAYGNHPAPATGANGNPAAPQVFQFVPTDNDDANTHSSDYRIRPVNPHNYFPTAPTDPSDEQPNDNTFTAPAVLASATPVSATSNSNSEPDATDKTANPWLIPAAALLISGSLLGVDRLLTLRERRISQRG